MKFLKFVNLSPICLSGLILILFSPGASFGAEGVPYHLRRGTNGELLLEGTSCDVVRKETKALRAWTTQLGEPLAAFPELVSMPNGRCYAVLDGSAPEIVRSLEGQRAPNTGPNCHNTALVASKMSKYLHFTGGREMTFWITSPLCRALQAEEAPEPGDIIVIRTDRPFAMEYHSMIYLSDDMVFSKHDTAAFWPFALQSIDGELAAFGIPASASATCKRATGAPNECSVFANYFRCDSFDNFLRAKQPTEKYVNAEKAMNAAERHIQCVTFAKEAPGEPMLTIVESSLNALEQLAKSELHAIGGIELGQIPSHKPTGNVAKESQIFLWESIWWKSFSLKSSLGMLRNRSPQKQ